VRRGELAVNAELMDLLFRSADVLETSIEGAVAGRAVPMDDVMRRLRAFGESRPSPAAPLPERSDEPNEWTAPLPVGAGMEAAEATGVRQSRHVRIDLRRLDSLMNLIGELVITRGRLLQISTGLEDPALADSVTQASRLIGDLRDEIMTSRMVPVWQIFDRF